jgi:hypothetical protein
MSRLRIGEYNSILLPTSRAPQVAEYVTIAAVSIMSKYMITGRPPTKYRQCAQRRHHTPVRSAAAEAPVSCGKGVNSIAVELSFEK